MQSHSKLIAIPPSFHTHTAYDIIDDDDVNDAFTGDPTLKTGKAFGILGALLGYVLFLFSLTYTFLGYPKAYKALFNVTAVLNFFLAVCSGILFVGVAHDFCSDDDFAAGVKIECKPSGAGYCAVIAFVFFVGAGASILVLSNCKGVLKPRRSGSGQQSSIPPTSVKMFPGQYDADTTFQHDDEEVVIEMTDNGDGTLTKTTTKTSYKPDGSKQIEKTAERVNNYAS